MSNRVYGRINAVLLVLIICINLYTVLLPFIPNFTYAVEHRSKAELPKASQVIKATENGPEDKTNRLVIPRMGLNTPIVEGPLEKEYEILNQGAWRLPFSANPSEQGNTVIAAHRFSYTGPRGVFYYLDKVQVGDEIAIRWNGQNYIYQVESIRTVKATETEIQEPTEDTRLTLYTCTPLINPVDRLVVVAKPVGPTATVNKSLLEEPAS